MTIRPLLLSLCAAAALAACGDDGTDPAVTSDTGTDAATSDAGDMTDTATADTGDQDTGTTDAGGEDTATADPTLADIHDQIFVASCGGLGCHMNGGVAGQINLDNDGGLRDRLLGPSTVRGVNLIEPGNPGSSYLYLKLTGEHFDVGGSGSRMPTARPALSEDLITLMADWINAGAPE